MPSLIKTPAWFLVYANVALIVLQKEKAVSVEIINQDIAASFKAYFNDLWAKSKPFK